MITLQIKNKMFSVRGHSTVKDENDVDRYVVKGKFFSLGKKKRIYDMDGRLVAERQFNTVSSIDQSIPMSSTSTMYAPNWAMVSLMD